MRTRSREGPGGGKPAESEALVSLPLQSPRSSKKRKAATSGSSSGGTPAAATKKSKEVATTLEPPAPSAPEAITPGKAGGKEGGSRSKTKKSASKAGEDDVAASGGKEGQSLGKDGKSGAHDWPVAPADRMGVAPKGRCVSGRDWKARNQSQRASMQRTTATETLSSSWAKKLEIKAKRQAIMAMEKEMRDAKLQEIEDKKQEKLEREKRRQQNEMKNTTYQTVRIGGV
ncbi:unnamed protein product [Ectocarpus fasciculatus]